MDIEISPSERELLDFHYELVKIGRSVMKTLRNKMKKAGIPINQFRILKKLHETPQLYLSTLNRKIKIKKENISRLVDRLEKMKYVSRGRDKNDRRKVYIMLTDTGRRALQGFLAEENKIVQEIYGSLPKTRFKSLMACVEELKSNIRVDL